jgi:hypothetical protein
MINLDKIVAKIRHEAFVGLKIGAEGMLHPIQNATPNRTGTMMRSQTITADEAHMTVTVSANTPYAKAVHDGSPPHVIVARKAKSLAVPRKDWKGIVHPYGEKKFPTLSKNGQFVLLGKRVRHPGHKGNPWMRRTIKANLDNLGRYVVQHVMESLRRDR